MEDVEWLKRIKDAVSFRQRAGDILSWAPKLGLVPKPPDRKPGISALMRVKNEARWIEAAVRSLAPFVDQFSIVDNGSSDGTPEIVRKVAGELSLDYVLEVLPTEDFGEVCDLALANTTCRWVLRWDGDMIARTQGGDTLARLREFVFSLDPDRYYVVYFPHIQLEGDLFHQDPGHLIHYEDYLFTYSSSLYHKRTGRFREVMYPLYYKRIYVWETSSFHLASLDEPAAMIRRKYWVEWRRLDDKSSFPTLTSYTEARIREEYGTDSLDEAGALYCRERFRGLVPYDRDRFGDYPELLEPFLDTFPLKMVYRGGKIAGRSDFIGLLDRLDAEMRKTPVDVVVSTRGRKEMSVHTVGKLLEQDYPNFRVVVVDQNDEPVSALKELSGTDPRLVYHVAGSRGLPAGRNEGLLLSRAEIVVFVDDDVEPEPGFIEGHVHAYRDETVGGTAGRVREVREEMNEPVPPDGPGRINYWLGELHRGFTADEPADIETAQGVNMSFRRRVLEEIGGFDTRFGGTFLYEETDVCLRVRKAGYRLRYVPDAALVHLGAPTGGCRMEDIGRQVYWYGHNFTLLFLKHFPRRTFPVWFAVRLAKFARDCFRYGGVAPLVSGLRGMFDGFRSYMRRE